MLSKKVIEVKEKGSPWLLTYGDMVTLLLVFFVFIFAFATIDVQRFREIAVSLRGSLGDLRGGKRIILPSDLPRSNPEAGQPVAVKSLVQAIPRPEAREENDSDFDNRGKKSGENTVFNRFLTQAGQIVTIPADIEMFKKGSTEITQEFEEFLSKLYDLIGYYEDNEITIIGRPDRVPHKSPIYPHNDWELASARALKVMNYYTKDLKVPNILKVSDADNVFTESPERFTVIAFGEYSENHRMIEIIFQPKRK